MRAEFDRKYNYFASQYNQQQKAYMEEHGITEELMAMYPEAVSRLMEQDGVLEANVTDAFLKSLLK